LRAKPSPPNQLQLGRAISATQQGPPPAKAAPSHEIAPRAAAPPLDFPEAALSAAWRRQAGLCAQCGRLLIWANRNRDSGIGAWQSHHRTPRDQGGTSDLKNCVLFCSGAGNCHYNVGHGGIGWDHYSDLEDAGLLYLRYGADKPGRTTPQTRSKPGLIRQVFGIGGPGKSRRGSGSNPKANRSGTSGPLLDDYDGVY